MFLKGSKARIYISKACLIRNQILQFNRSGNTGLIVTVVGALMMGAAFILAYGVFSFYMGEAQSNVASQASGFVQSLNNLLYAAIVVMFLGIMGWVGSVFVMRGVDFLKVDRGIGVVTFKVDKGVGVVSGVEITSKSRKKQEDQALDLSKAEQS